MKGRTNNDWLVKAIKDESEKASCSWKMYRYGTICQPTGTGKTSEMIKFIADMIKTARVLGKKVIFNIASHRLNLSFQNVGNIVYTLSQSDLIQSDNTAIVINSSDDSEKYGNDSDLGNFRPLKLDTVADSRKDFYIIVSCYKSHYKLEDYISKGGFKDYIKVSLWDESHKISCVDNDEESNVNVDKCLNIFDNVYALSATPDEALTRKLSEKEASVNPNWKHTVDLKHIKHLSIRKAIKEKRILPVSFMTMTTPDLSDTEMKAHFCKNAIMKLKKRTPGLTHKVLISADSTPEAQEYFEYFKENRKAVFMTTSKTGYKTNVEELKSIVEDANATITDFTDAIKQYDGECVVIHIRQLIEGIDIDCLTATIIFDTPNETNRVSLIQTIGRILRFKEGDRDKKTGLGKNIEDRIKKYGYVIWGMEESQLNASVSEIGDFFIRNYDCGDCQFIISRSKKNNSNGTTEEIEEDYQSTPWQNKFGDFLRTKTGFASELESVMIDTVDALMKFLPYTKIVIPNSMQYKELRTIIQSRIDSCVKTSYSVEDWANDDDNLIEKTKYLMVNREPKLEEVFKKFGYTVENIK